MKPTTAVTLVLLTALLFPAPAHAGRWTWPVSGEVITPYRNGDDPYAGGQHRGIDIAAAAGDPVVAAAAGTVRFAGVAGSSGLTVSVRTADGRFDTSYLHLADTTVREGDTVHPGDVLGGVGTSGHRSAERPHLHFGVREAGARHVYRDPLDFLGSPPPRGEPRDPEPAPAPSEARAEPLGAPAPAPQRAPTPAPAPAPARSPASNPVSRPSPGHAFGRAARPVALHAAHPFRPRSPNAARTDGDATIQPSPGPSPARSARPSAPGAQAERPVVRPQRKEPVTPGARRNEGVDIGWLAACLGLLLASTALGRAATARRGPAVTSSRRRAAPTRLIPGLGAPRE